MSEFLDKFGKRIKDYRKIKKLSQEKLAELIDASTNTISALELGKTFITYKNLQKLCKVLEIQEVDLFNFSMKNKKQASIVDEINNEVKKLSLQKQKQILEIIKTFDED